MGGVTGWYIPVPSIFSSVSGWWVWSRVYSMSDVNEWVIGCLVKVKLSFLIK